MKFTSSVFAALAVGTAMAVPMNAERSYDVEDYPLPLPIPAGIYPPEGAVPTAPTATHPAFSTSTPSTFSALPTHPSSSLSTFPVAPPAHTGLPTPGEGGSHPGAGGPPNVNIIIKEIDIKIIEIEELVDIDIAAILKLIAAPEVDAKALLKLIIELKGHVGHIYSDVIPLILKLKGGVFTLVEADLKLILHLAAKVEAIIVKVETVIKQIFHLKAEVLALIIVEVKGLISLILSITAPFTSVIIGLLAKVDVKLVVGGLIGKILSCVSHITSIVEVIVDFHAKQLLPSGHY